jgi:hypothetical protein
LDIELALLAGRGKTSAMQSRQSSSAAWMAGGVMQVRDDLDIIG